MQQATCCMAAAPGQLTPNGFDATQAGSLWDLVQARLQQGTPLPLKELLLIFIQARGTHTAEAGIHSGQAWREGRGESVLYDLREHIHFAAWSAGCAARQYDGALCKQLPPLGACFGRCAQPCRPCTAWSRPSPTGMSSHTTCCCSGGGGLTVAVQLPRARRRGSSRACGGLPAAARRQTVGAQSMRPYP